MKTISVLLLTAVLAAGCREGSDPSAAPRPVAVTATAPATAPPPPSLDDLPAGPPPRVAYVDQDGYVDAGGRRASLGAPHGISGVVPYDGGFLVSDTRWFEGTVGLAALRDGRVTDEWCSSGTPVGTGRWVAWTELSCPETAEVVRAEVVRVRPDGSGRAAQPVTGSASVVGLLGPRVVYNQPSGGAWISDVVDPPARVPGIDGAADVDAAHGRLIGWRGDRARVVALDGTPLWRYGRGSLESFSPDGTQVLARRTGGLRILDAADGSAIASVPLPFRQVLQLGWEDERHLLAVVVRGGRTAVVRLGTDGSVERATPSASYAPSRPAFVLLD